MNGHFADEIRERMKKGDATTADGVLFLKLFRVGTIGQKIFEECSIPLNHEDYLRSHLLASLVDLYIYYLRSIYDRLHRELDDKLSNDNYNRFEKFRNKIMTQKFETLSMSFRKMVEKDGFEFATLRNLRDSLKRGSAAIVISMGPQFIRVRSKVYARDENSTHIIDEDLHSFIFRFSFSFWFFSTWIYMEKHSLTWEDLNKKTS